MPGVGAIDGAPVQSGAGAGPPDTPDSLARADDMGRVSAFLAAHPDQAPAVYDALVKAGHYSDARSVAETHAGADGGEGFLARSWREMGEAVDHPIDALSGAGKGIVNAFADVGTLLLQGGALQSAGEMEQAAGYQAMFGQSAQAEQSLKAAEDVRAGASQIRIPDLPMTTPAQAGGDKIATLAMMAADGAGLAKGLISGGARAGVKEAGVLARGVAKAAPDTRVFTRTARELEELAKDPAHAGAISPKSIQERTVGLDLEKRGAVPGPLTRDPSGAAEFIDARGVKWDVKGFNSGFPARQGGFSLARDAGKVEKSLSQGEHVMLDTSKMSAADVAALKAEGAARGWGARVLFWP